MKCLRHVILICFALAGCSSERPVSCGIDESRHGQFAGIPEGKFISRREKSDPNDGGSRSLDVSAFEMQVHEVTNAQFSVFVGQTQYVTDAERSFSDLDAKGGSALFVMPQMNDDKKSDKSGSSTGWELSMQATWQTPEGAGTDLRGLEYYPVTHVSLNDARAYAKWAGGRLPSELEWEYVATLGLFDALDDTSGAYKADGTPIANTWQGVFPILNTVKDGFQGPSPVGCFEVNRLGLFDMIGNVWEWTETRAGGRFNIIKGGSFLCANNFCRRYRPSARQTQEFDFSTNHIGFRLVRDVGPAN
jgi:sulfatase modifying factor 1